MIFEPTDQTIENAAAALRAGKLVAFPTETVYGLGANALDPQAVAEIYRLKGRPSSNPLIVHVADAKQIADIASVENSEQLQKIASSFWPGPLAVVLPRRPIIPAIVSGGQSTVAIRIPSHPVALKLLKLSGPVAAPSANRSNAVSPTTAAHVLSEFGDSVEFILDGGSCDVGIESTVLSLVHSVPTILRLGFYTREQIQSVLNIPIEIQPFSKNAQMIAPGMLEKHYSPRTPLCFVDQLSPEEYGKKLGLLSFFDTRSPHPFTPSITKCLNPTGDLRVAAHNLYFMLRELDEIGLDLIVVERCSREGIGAAIMDRLDRAAA